MCETAVGAVGGEGGVYLRGVGVVAGWVGIVDYVRSGIGGVLVVLPMVVGVRVGVVVGVWRGKVVGVVVGVVVGGVHGRTRAQWETVVGLAG